MREIRVLGAARSGAVPLLCISEYSRAVAQLRHSLNILVVILAFVPLSPST